MRIVRQRGHISGQDARSSIERLLGEEAKHGRASAEQAQVERLWMIAIPWIGSARQYPNNIDAAERK